MKTTEGEAGRPTKLRRPQDNRMLFGVAAGIAEHFDLDRTVVRLGLVVLALAGGIGVPLYVAALLLIPEEGAERSLANELVDHYRFS
jgi:phage shock protein PspC (stress-responsive transcriptional regulator)